MSHFTFWIIFLPAVAFALGVMKARKKSLNDDHCDIEREFYEQRPANRNRTNANP